MPKPATRRLVGALDVICICLLIAMTIFVTADYVRTLAARQALTPADTETVAGEPLGPGQSMLEALDPTYPAENL